MQQLQEDFHTADFDYRNGSPHLVHWRLYFALVTQLRHILETTADKGLSPVLLDVGAGDGSFVEPVLSFGYKVTALEMSRHAIATLEDRYGRNPAFCVMLDEDGSLSILGPDRFGVILYTSVLHHIPDYKGAVNSAITNHLEIGGSFVSFQDPLLYSGVSRLTRTSTQIGYFWWRLAQGNLRRGARTRVRRIRGVYDETNPADMSEYHVVRNGVDQEELVQILSSRFEDVSMIAYWSSQSALWQRLGERLGLRNSFGIVATGFRG